MHWGSGSQAWQNDVHEKKQKTLKNGRRRADGAHDEDECDDGRLVSHLGRFSAPSSLRTAAFLVLLPFVSF